MINNIKPTNNIPLTQLIDEWTDRNDSAYNQLLFHVYPELQTTIDTTDIANITWTLLTKKFRYIDPSKLSIFKDEIQQLPHAQRTIGHTLPYHHERIQDAA